MKIGIFTFHCAHNYGAVFQAYALQTFLSDRGYDVYIIDYKPKYLTDVYRKNSLKYWIARSIKDTILKLRSEPKLIKLRHKRYNGFEKFTKKYFRILPFEQIGMFSGNDVLVFGSDQIWNPKLTGNRYDPVFFGEGLNGKKIAYAASNKTTSFNDEDRVYFREKLKSFYSIGVRETSLKDLLQPLTDKNIEVNLDPTLLAGNNWINSLGIEKPKVSNFVFLYEIERHESVRKKAIELSKRKGLKLVELVAFLTLDQSSDLDQTASPLDFLSYIKYADYVVTTSFHGTAISILLNKDFYYIRQNNEADNRIFSLLKQLTLEDRIVAEDTKLPLVPIDYEEVNKRLSVLCQKSANYLIQAIESDL